nr:cocaine esterase-like [Lytechinus pictus]
MNSFHVDLCIAALCLWGSCALAVEVIGNPAIELGDATLTGITVRFDDPLFMEVNKSIDAYLGVPFAEPPVGERRFTDPEPLVLQGEYNATEDKAECPQMSPLDDWTPSLPPLIPTLPGPIPTRTISEDCLYLSIYTPSPKPSSLVPVLVWIHGGGYAVGGGSEIIYDPIPIVAYADIIVVNVNYRLGVFGFFTTGKDDNEILFNYTDKALRNAFSLYYSAPCDLGPPPLSSPFRGPVESYTGDVLGIHSKNMSNPFQSSSEDYGSHVLLFTSRAEAPASIALGDTETHKRQDLINVVILLGGVGCVSVCDDEATGNYGMMDQVLALQWVHDNIQDFGGDPNQVTIAGESAGGGSVSLHMLSPLTEDLFHQTIMQLFNSDLIHHF